MFKAQWDAKVEAAKARCKDPMAAVAKVNRDNPGLRERMLAEVNGLPMPPRPEKSTTISFESQRFNDEVDYLVANGLDRRAAIQQIIRTKPHLRQQMVAAANRHHR